MAFIAHISDLHVGALAFKKELINKVINDINNMNPDICIVTGDITENGYYQEFIEAVSYLEQIEAPLVVVPGNHDARHVGDQCFQKLISERYAIHINKENNFKVLGLDSSEPDLDYGKIGRSQQKWIEKELRADAGLHKIIALHHHIIPVPKTGRERNVLSDAGDILLSVIEGDAHLVLSGHKHMPHVWQMGKTIFATAGTASSMKLRGEEMSSFNTIRIQEDKLDIILHSADGKERYLVQDHNCW